MEDDLFKMVGILFVSLFIIYIVVKLFHLQASVLEGLTNPDSSTNSIPVSGEAGTSASYAAGIKAQVVKLQDELLVSKYRKDYETAIINLDDYCGMLLLQNALNMNTSGDLKTNMEKLNNMNTLRQAKDSLNVAMKFLDAQ
uniref:Uncharacterized protein n=1 Tax=viral metagenome TaxID=1070528 RepID=A0A6C0IVY1_9ZZZZ